MAPSKENPLFPEHHVARLRHSVRDAVLPHTQVEKEQHLKEGIVLGSIFLLGIISLSVASSVGTTSLSDSNARVADGEGFLPLHAAATSTKLSGEEELRWVPTTTLVASAITLPELPEPPPFSPPPPEPRQAIYLTGNSIARTDGFYEKSLKQIAEAGHAAVVIDVKEGFVFYDTESPLAHEFGTIQRKYELKKAVETAKAHGLKVIARFVAGKDRGLAVARSDTHIRHPATGRSVGSVWVDLSNETVHEYNKQLIEEVALAGFDFMNIDYIRFPTEYPPVQIGLTPDEKVEHVESFLKMARETINEVNPDMQLGISTFAILGWDYEINMERLGQDVVRFAPYVDVISPMAYEASFAPNHYYTGETGRSRMYELVYKTLMGYRKLLGEEHSYKILPWIQGYRVTMKDMKDQIDAVYDSGSCGFMIWSPSNLYSAYYAARKDIEIPEECDV